MPLPLAVQAWIIDLLQREELEALLLLGSRARGDVGEESDVDLVGVRSRGKPEGRYELMDGVPVELVMVSWAGLASILEGERDARWCQLVSQYRWAAPLWDPTGQASAFLERVARIAQAGPPPLSPAEMDHLGFELRHGARILARTQTSAVQQLVAAELARTVAYAALRLAGVWPPSLKRLFPALETADPELALLCRSLLVLDEPPAAIVDRIARHLASRLPKTWQRWVG